MKKTAPRIIITLPEPLRREVKRAAKEAHLTESAFIREAIKSRLRNPPEDPLYWLLRIPLKSITDSTPSRSSIPLQTDR